VQINNLVSLNQNQKRLTGENINVRVYVYILLLDVKSNLVTIN